MDEARCPECGASPPAEGAKFCHECGAALPAPEAPPAPPPPPQEPTPPSRPGRSRLLGPAIVAAAGAALLILGFVVGGGDETGDRPADPLRASGILDVPPPVEDDLGPAPPSTVADFSSDHSGTPSTTAGIPPLDEWQVVLSDSFADNGASWPTGDSEGVTRALVDGRYRIATEGAEGATIHFTWRTNVRPPVWFRLRAEVARPGGGAGECGLALAAADARPWVAVVLDDAGQRFRAIARETEDADIEVLLDWTERPDLILPDQPNTLELIGRDDGVWILVGDLAVAKLALPSFPIELVGMVLRSPGGGTAAACEFDDFLISWP